MSPGGIVLTRCAIQKDGAVVVKQLQEITMYPEKVCWRLAERHGFRRPHFRREWSREDIEQILKMCESDRLVTEIVEYFDTTVRTIHQGMEVASTTQIPHLQFSRAGWFTLETEKSLQSRKSMF